MKFALSSGRFALPGSPPMTGNSQSMSTPSRPFAARNATHDAANFAREASESATSENRFDPPQPPTEIRAFRWGCLAFRARRSAKASRLATGSST